MPASSNVWKIVCSSLSSSVSSSKSQLIVYGPTPPNASPSNTNVAGAWPWVPFEIISAARAFSTASSSVAVSSLAISLSDV
ncbi:MAG: hypothetical protein M3270_10425 [Thermoproteota archaeon]|nr:hypothetical protein [Thermoproteota archaeon]